MIGVDTNVLIRFVVNDDATQHSAAQSFLAERTRSDPAFIALVTLVETVWTLRTRYRLTDEAIARFVRGLLGAEEIVLQAPDVVRRALREAGEVNGGFVDAVIGLLAIDTDCDYTVTFDKRAASLPGMRLLEP